MYTKYHIIKIDFLFSVIIKWLLCEMPNEKQSKLYVSSTQIRRTKRTKQTNIQKIPLQPTELLQQLVEFIFLNSINLFILNIIASSFWTQDIIACGLGKLLCVLFPIITFRHSFKTTKSIDYNERQSNNKLFQSLFAELFVLSVLRITNFLNLPSFVFEATKNATLDLPFACFMGVLVVVIIVIGSTMSLTKLQYYIKFTR
jgi:hypothetical protein